MDNLTFLENKIHGGTISILSIPLDIGSDNSDMADAPKYLLKLGLKKALESAGFKINILPELPVSKKSFWKTNKTRDNNLNDISDIVSRANKIVKKEILQKNKVLAIGGDHTISIGTIAGASEAVDGNLGVIWIDAHGDINTHETSLSGNVHGMASAAILGFGDTHLTNLVKTKIKKENILYIGLQDLDQAEIDLMRNQNISVITMWDILENGFSVITKNIELLKKKVDNIWISLDVDVIDEQFAPASAMATSGGLSYREITNLLNYIGKTSNVIGMDLVEITPKKDIENKTGKLCIELVASGFGSKYNWYSKYMSHYKKSK
ncbi:MAG: arginase [bacterium]|nr:arginase [bacterium]